LDVPRDRGDDETRTYINWLPYIRMGKYLIKPHALGYTNVTCA